MVAPTSTFLVDSSLLLTTNESLYLAASPPSSICRKLRQPSNRMYRSFVPAGTYSVPFRQAFSGKASVPQLNGSVISDITLVKLSQPENAPPPMLVKKMELFGVIQNIIITFAAAPKQVKIWIKKQ